MIYGCWPARWLGSEIGCKRLKTGIISYILLCTNCRKGLTSPCLFCHLSFNFQLQLPRNFKRKEKKRKERKRRKRKKRKKEKNERKKRMKERKEWKKEKKRKKRKEASRQTLDFNVRKILPSKLGYFLFCLLVFFFFFFFFF